MSLKNAPDFLKTTTFRLTLWYVGLFTLLSLLVFSVLYVFLASHLHDQTDKQLRNAAQEFRSLYGQDGLAALQAEFKRESRSQGIGRVFFLLRAEHAEILASSDLTAWPATLLDHLPQAAARQTIQAIALPPSHLRILTTVLPEGRQVLVIGRSLAGEEELLARYRLTFTLALLIMLLGGGVMGWLLARKAMAGVKRVTLAAQHTGWHDVAGRVALGREGQEINELVHAYNDMLARIEGLLHELEQITDNIAHELRTPLTRIRGIAEVAIQQTSKPGDCRESAGQIIEECDGLIAMINTMLEIARTGAGGAKLDLVPLDLVEIGTEAVDLYTPLAEDNGLRLTMQWPGDELLIPGDRPRLQRLVANLLDNAIKYTPDGGQLSLLVSREDKWALLRVGNSGPGIAAEEIPQVFNRFYRAEKSRSSGGSGLGLSLAQAIVQAHGGTIMVQSEAGQTCFTVTLPLLL